MNKNTTFAPYTNRPRSLNDHELNFRSCYNYNVVDFINNFPREVLDIDWDLILDDYRTSETLYVTKEGAHYREVIATYNQILEVTGRTLSKLRNKKMFPFSMTSNEVDSRFYDYTKEFRSLMPEWFIDELTRRFIHI